MDKLIDYEGLGTFQTNILNDNKISPIATWSSEKITDELNNKVSSTALATALAGKQNTLTAGSNISISNNVISASNAAEGYVWDASKHSFATKYGDNWGLKANTASGTNSFASGNNTTASGENSHTEGLETTASGLHSHAEGIRTTATESYSHTEGTNTLAQNKGEHAQGILNISHKANTTVGDAGNTIHSIGIGLFVTQSQSWNRRNAHEVMQNGDMYILGIGNYDGVHIKNEQGAPANLQTLQEVIAALEARIAALENPNA